MTDKVIALWDHGRWFSGLPPADVQAPTGNLSRRAVDGLAQTKRIYVLHLDEGELWVERLGPEPEKDAEGAAD